MNARPKAKPRLDRVDAEAIKEMLESRGWLLFMQRMTVIKATKHEELEQPQDEIKTATCRGYLEAVRAIASIPDILFREGSRGKASDE